MCSGTGRAGAIEFMSSLTGAEYVNNTALTGVLADALQVRACVCVCLCVRLLISVHHH